MVEKSRMNPINYDDLEAVKDFVKISTAFSAEPQLKSEPTENEEKIENYGVSSAIDENSHLIKFMTEDLKSSDLDGKDDVNRDIDEAKDHSSNKENDENLNSNINSRFDLRNSTDTIEQKIYIKEEISYSTRSPFKPAMNSNSLDIVQKNDASNSKLTKSRSKLTSPIAKSADKTCNGLKDEVSKEKYDPKSFKFKKLNPETVQRNIIAIGALEIYHVKKFIFTKNGKKGIKSLRASDIIGRESENEKNLQTYLSKIEIKNNSSIIEALEIIKGGKVSEPIKETYVVNKFFLGPTLATLNINDKMDITDYKNRNIYDIISRKRGWNKWISSIIKISGNKLIFYKPETVKITVNDVKDEFFPSIDDNLLYHPVDFEIDLKYASLYVAKKSNSWCKYLFCCFRSDYSDLENITNSEISKVMPNGADFNLEINKNPVPIKISHLDIIILYNDLLYRFRCESQINFIKWIKIIQMRRNYDGEY